MQEKGEKKQIQLASNFYDTPAQYKKEFRSSKNSMHDHIGISALAWELAH